MVACLLAAWVCVMSVGYPASASAKGSDDDEALDLLTDMADLEMQALDLWWTSIFLDGGWDEPMVAYVLVQPGESYTSECYWEEDEPLVITGETESAYYCDYDVAPVNGEDQNGVIWLPVAFRRSTWELISIEPSRSASISSEAHQSIRHESYTKKSDCRLIVALMV